MVTAEEIIACLEAMADEAQARQLMRFFKTGKGQYGEGDRFLGLRCPLTRTVVREARLQVPFGEIEKLLYSRWHEVRFAGFQLLVEEMKAAKKDAVRRDEIAAFFLRHARQANNWDLVDMTCPKILGEWLVRKPGGRQVLDRLVESHDLWEQRIGIVTTWRIIREGQFDDTLRLAARLLDHPHDLMHKATGWMLREVGKKDMDVLRDFLEKYSSRMPRTALRYAIEKMAEPERKFWLQRK